jgi:hypothetical protein
MAGRAKPHMTIDNLPTDVLTCILWHLQQDAWQRKSEAG